MRIQKHFFIVFSLLLSLWVTPIFSAPVQSSTTTKPALNPNYPKRYVVKKGDTLWDIAGKILQHPWHWKELLATNPHIKNPQRIYPGDVIEIVVLQNKPVISIKQTGTVKLSPKPTTVKLSPKVRSETLDNAIPTIPLVEIKPFLTGNRIVMPEALQDAPHIVAHESERIIAGTGDVIYVSGLHTEKNAPSQYALFRRGESFTNPTTKELIGINAVYVGDAELLKSGDPATMILSNTNGEVVKGDKLLPRDTSNTQVHFMPKAPNRPINGQIISIEGGLALVGQYQVIIIDQGRTNGLEVGDVLDIYTNSRTVTNLGDDGEQEEPVKIPGYKQGEMMVFRTFDKASYGLILTANSPIQIMNKVTNPMD